MHGKSLDVGDQALDGLRGRHGMLLLRGHIVLFGLAMIYSCTRPDDTTAGQLSAGPAVARFRIQDSSTRSRGPTVSTVGYRCIAAPQLVGDVLSRGATVHW